jgi:hypothetical protein
MIFYNNITYPRYTVNEDCVIIDKKDIVTSLFSIILSALFYEPLIFLYLNMTNKQSNNIQTLYFMVSIVAGISFIFNEIKIICIKILNYNKYLPGDYYNQMYVPSYFSILFQLFVCFPMISFIPYDDNNCLDYDYGLCLYGRFFGTVGFLLLCGEIFVVMYGMYMIFQCVKEIINSYRYNTKAYYKYVNIDTNMIIDIENNICSICLNSKEDYIIANEFGYICCNKNENNTNFVEIACGHQFHEMCIKNLFKYDFRRCPLCRSEMIPYS